MPLTFLLALRIKERNDLKIKMKKKVEYREQNFFTPHFNHFIAKK